MLANNNPHYNANLYIILNGSLVKMYVQYSFQKQYVQLYSVTVEL